jgi:hypothetical protein
MPGLRTFRDLSTVKLKGRSANHTIKPGTPFAVARRAVQQGPQDLGAGLPIDPEQTLRHRLPSVPSHRGTSRSMSTSWCTAKHEKLPPRKKTTYEPKGEKRWKTSVQLSKRHENIVNEVVMHYRMQGLRPVSVNTVILAALDGPSHLSKPSGQTTIIKEQVTRFGRGIGTQVSTMMQEAQRPLLTPVSGCQGYKRTTVTE